jgi:hypothetical protein
MSSFLSLVLYVGIALVAVMAAIIVVSAVIGIVVAFSPTLIPGFLQS